jgi:hypothetical protein
MLPHLIHANARERGIIGLAIDIEHIFHVVDKVRIGFLGKAPGFLEPRLELVFLSVFLIVSELICST